MSSSFALIITFVKGITSLSISPSALGQYGVTWRCFIACFNIWFSWFGMVDHCRVLILQGSQNVKRSSKNSFGMSRTCTIRKYYNRVPWKFIDFYFSIWKRSQVVHMNCLPHLFGNLCWFHWQWFWFLMNRLTKNTKGQLFCYYLVYV